MLDDAVVALGAGVGQAGLHRGDDGFLPVLDGAGEADHLGYLAGGTESVEAVQCGGDLVAKPTAVGALEQFTEQLFGDPRRGDVLVRVGA